MTLVRPFSGGGQKEIVKSPKVYGFDTGFVSFCRGWDPLRPEDYGILWEHVVLEYLQAHAWNSPIYYWRDVAGREIDFIIPRKRDAIDVIECKWDPSHFDSAALKTFRSFYPNGKNFLLSPHATRRYAKRISGLDLQICNLDGWRNE